AETEATRKTHSRLHCGPLSGSNDGGAAMVGTSPGPEIHAALKTRENADSDFVGGGRSDHSGCASADVAETHPSRRYSPVSGSRAFGTPGKTRSSFGYWGLSRSVGLEFPILNRRSHVCRER